MLPRKIIDGAGGVNLWVQLGATLFIGLMTAGGALLGVRWNTRVGERATEQKERQARREEWAKRFHEALAYVVDDAPRKRAVGLHFMAALAESELAGPDERKLMAVFADRVIGPLMAELAAAGQVDELDDEVGAL